MTYDELFNQIQKKQSFLCIGLDTDINKIPAHLLLEEDPVFAFNRSIVDATLPYAVAYKPNLAFYEALGTSGWESLRKTVAYIRSQSTDVFVIADAKRGDIGNTSKMYAHTFFDHIGVDAVTLSPYMGKDTVEPFLKYKDRWSVLLALTSNESGSDFQMFKACSGDLLFEEVLKTASHWASSKQLMFVVGATKAKYLKNVRTIVPDYFLLVPGIGAQGGSLEEVARYGMNSHCGLLVNSSRNIIYASTKTDFAKQAGAKAHELQIKMKTLLKKYQVITG